MCQLGDLPSDAESQNWLFLKQKKVFCSGKGSNAYCEEICQYMFILLSTANTHEQAATPLKNMRHDMKYKRPLYSSALWHGTLKLCPFRGAFSVGFGEVYSLTSHIWKLLITDFDRCFLSFDLFVWACGIFYPRRPAHHQQNTSELSNLMWTRNRF